MSPMRIVLPSSQHVASISLNNRGDTPISFKVTTKQIRQHKGHIKSSFTKDLLAIPPVIKIPPHKQQVVRVLFRGPLTNKNELMYQVILSDLTHGTTNARNFMKNPLKPKGSLSAQTSIRYAFAVPVFVEPLHTGVHRVSWYATLGKNDYYRLKVDNIGNYHLGIGSISLLDSKKGSVLYKQVINHYVFPGNSKTFILKKKGHVGDKLNLLIKNADGEIRTRVTVK